MATITKAQLQAEVEALRHNNELLRVQRDSAQAELASAYNVLGDLKARHESLTTELAAERYSRAGDTSCAQQALDMLHAKVSNLVAENSALTAKLDMLTKPSRKVTQHAPRAKVFEFDPSINGDYKRAATLAREFGGVVRRMQA